MKQAGFINTEVDRRMEFAGVRNTEVPKGMKDTCFTSTGRPVKSKSQEEGREGEGREGVE